jgi:hypothetical protein
MRFAGPDSTDQQQPSAIAGIELLHEARRAYLGQSN